MGVKSARIRLDAALAKVELERGYSIYEHAVRMAYSDNTVLVALMRKLIPDKREDTESDEVVRTFLVRARAEIEKKEKKEAVFEVEAERDGELVPVPVKNDQKFIRA